MELKFLGRGAALNPKEGNTSAFFVEDNQLFLIDCGENIFTRIIELDILKNINTINLMITHTHSDHIGSLGSLASYNYYHIGKPLNILIQKDIEHLDNIKSILSSFGCNSVTYNFVDIENFDNKYKNFQNIRYIKTDHCTELNSYSLMINTSNGLIYYSGDTRETDTIKAILASKRKIDKLYIEVTTDDYPGNVHLNINLLDKSISKEQRTKIYCMHVNNNDCITEAKNLGFNVVECYVGGSNV